MYLCSSCIYFRNKLVIVTLVALQLFKIAYCQSKTADETCPEFHGKSIEYLLDNVPHVPSTKTLISCLPEDLVNEFTGKNSRHIQPLVACLDDFKYCKRDGYLEITSKHKGIKRRIERTLERKSSNVFKR